VWQRATPLDAVVLRIVSSREADTGVLADLINQAFAIYPFMTEDRTTPDGVAEEAGDSARFILAEAEGRTVGCAMIRPATHVGPILETNRRKPGLDEMYYGLASVDRAAMRGGIGRSLLRRAENEALAAGFTKVVLGTLREMGNVEYYAALGYRTIGTEDFEAGHWAISIPHQEHEMLKDLVP
jgi:predicted N-acetyltransferase YhbS